MCLASTCNRSCRRSANVEALTRANQLALEGMQAVFKRQAEILRQSLEESSSMGREIAGAGSPQEKMARQTDIAKEAFEKALAEGRSLDFGDAVACARRGARSTAGPSRARPASRPRSAGSWKWWPSA